MKGARGGPHSLAADSRCCRLEFNRHTPRRSNLCSSTLRITRWNGIGLLLSWSAVFAVLAVGYAGSLKLSPRASIAQHMRAFFAAMAMQGYSANPAYIDWLNAEVAAQARDRADHLLAALATPSEERKP